MRGEGEGCGEDEGRCGRGELVGCLGCGVGRGGGGWQGMFAMTDLRMMRRRVEGKMGAYASQYSIADPADRPDLWLVLQKIYTPSLLLLLFHSHSLYHSSFLRHLPPHHHHHLLQTLKPSSQTSCQSPGSFYRYRLPRHSLSRTRILRGECVEEGGRVG